MPYRSQCSTCAKQRASCSSSHLVGFPVSNKHGTEVNIPDELHLFSLSLDLSHSSTTSDIEMERLRSVDHTNGQLVSTLEDLHSLLGGHSVSDLSTVGVVVHHEELQVLDIAHSELVESVGEHVLGAGIGTVTNVGHQGGTTEAASAATINTLGLSPVLLHASEHGTTNTTKEPTFILLNLSAWKRGNDVVLFFTIFTLRTGLITIYEIC